MWKRDEHRAGPGGIAALVLAACSSANSEPAHMDVVDDQDLDEVEVAEDGRPKLCESDRKDKVRDAFCGDTSPEVESLTALQKLLGLVPGALDTPYADEYGANSFVTLLSHSTSLSGARISPINPRMIVIGEGAIMAFERGAQRVEVVARARDGGDFNYYLFRFEQACNNSDEGCSFGDLFTPRVEQDWLRVTVEDDVDLANTPQDCRQCHQRATQYSQLLMRELESPWTHFFQPEPQPTDAALGPGVQGDDLLQDYLDAKGDEPYGGFKASDIVRISPFVLQSTVSIDQPVLFDAPRIENERFPFDPEAGYPEEAVPSRTWEEAYEAWKRGDQLALPYLDPRATDQRKQADLSEAYQRYRSGELQAHDLPNLADVFPDDPRERARIGLQTEPGATPVDALIQACGSCHNNVLDQTLTRARFNIDLWQLDRRELQKAIERIERAPGERGVMPPPEARALDPAARQQLLEYLREDPLQLPPDLKLQRAARIGMAGGKGARGQIGR